MYFQNFQPFSKANCLEKYLVKSTENKEQSQKLTRTVRTECFPPFDFKPFFDHEGVGNQKN